MNSRKGKLFRLLILAALLYCGLPGFSQGEWNNWYFGNQTGFTLNYGSPQAIASNLLSTARNTVSVSDSLGNLLFYSDGTKVLNRNNTVMPNGNNLHGRLCDRMVGILQKIDDDSSYYLFTMDATIPTAPYNGLHYSVINMRLDGGLGDIEPGQKEIQLQSTASHPTQMIITRHRNNRDAWVIIRNTYNENNFAAYLVTASGISTTPVISATMTNWNTIPVCNGGYISLSPDGTKLLVPHHGNADSVQLYNFITANGNITPRFFLTVGTFWTQPWCYSAFSWDSHYLYISTGDWPATPTTEIYQYDATAPDSASFKQSEVLVGHAGHGVHLQLAPDHKIYGDLAGHDSICVIHNPEIGGTGCGFQTNYLKMINGNCTQGVPVFVQRYYSYIRNAGSCTGSPVHFFPWVWPPPDSVSWNFGDPVSGPANVSSLEAPNHLYSTPGTYLVEMILRHDDKRIDTTWRTISINAAPQPALGPDQTICTPQTATFDAGACSGCGYEWKDLGSGLIVGTNQTYTTGAPGIYTVAVTGPNGCAGRDTVQLTIAAPVTMNVSVTGPPGTICAGATATFTASATNTGSTPAYQWKVNGVNASNATNASYAYNANNGDMVTCVVTSSDPCVFNSPASSIPYPVSVSLLLPVSITVAASQNPVCAGTSVNFTATPVNGGTSPAYQWKVNGVNATNATNASYAYNASNGDQVSCILTSSELCVSGNPGMSNTITMTVDPAIPVSVTITATGNPGCAGNTVTFTAHPVNPGTNPGYQWYVNNAAVGSTNSTYAYIPANGDCVHSTLAADVTCASPGLAVSNVICVTMNPPLPVSVSVAALQNPVCAGAQATFFAAAVNGGTSPGYQWKVNGVNATNATNASYAYNAANGDLVSCTVTSSDPCVSNNPASSIQYPVSVLPLLAVSISITASANPFCAGSSVTFTSNASNAGSAPAYQWKVNGINAPNASNASYAYNAGNGDLVSCIVTSSEICVSGNPGMSNTITMTVNTNLPAGVTISTPNNPFCPGTTVAFTAVPVNGGLSPIYQWKVNGINATNATNASYAYNAGNGDLVSCVMTSNLACVTSNPATAPSIMLSERAAPNVTFTTCFDTVTFVTAQPIRLKGGIPPGGVYSGAGVNSVTGYFSPAVAGIGLGVIAYSYSNVYTCMASKTKTILVKPASSFTCGSSFTDPRDNKSYTTVQLGSQCWMKENLDFGIRISELTPQTDNCISEKYSNSSSLIFNSAYQWDELMAYETVSGTQGLCPPGWHIPTAAEWSALLTTLGGPGFAGGPMKDILLATGFRSHQNGFLYLNHTWAYETGMDAGAMYWTSTASGTDRAIARGLNVQIPSVSLYPSARGNAFSVRCVRDGN